MASRFPEPPPTSPAAPLMPSAAADDPAVLGRRLLRAARVGTLATTAQGQPFASLVTPACLPDLSVILLLSTLSEHTRHLLADPRCSLLVAGPAETINPQTAPRLTVTGIAEQMHDAAIKARFLAVHPYAALYADFGDFSTWRIRPVAGLFVGGFARAHRLNAAALTPDAAAVAAIAAAEADMLARCNRDHAAALRTVADLPGDWRMVTLDSDGFDLAREDRVIRLAWPVPVRDAAAAQREFLRMAEAAECEQGRGSPS